MPALLALLLGNRQQGVEPVQRILVRQGVSRDLANLLLGDIRESIAHFDKHPVSVAMTKEESGGFSHL